MLIECVIVGGDSWVDRVQLLIECKCCFARLG